jgi:hypothetical protein
LAASAGTDRAGVGTNRRARNRVCASGLDPDRRRRKRSKTAPARPALGPFLRSRASTPRALIRYSGLWSPALYRLRQTRLQGRPACHEVCLILLPSREPEFGAIPISDLDVGFAGLSVPQHEKQSLLHGWLLRSRHGPREVDPCNGSLCPRTRRNTGFKARRTAWFLAASARVTAAGGPSPHPFLMCLLTGHLLDTKGLREG